METTGRQYSQAECNVMRPRSCSEGLLLSAVLVQGSPLRHHRSLQLGLLIIALTDLSGEIAGPRKPTSCKQLGRLHLQWLRACIDAGNHPFPSLQFQRWVITHRGDVP